jgi:thiol-disulfide isomerase/thioredoxin
MSQVNPIITKIDGFPGLQGILQKNPGLVVVKFGAEWCGPCKKIEPIVNKWFTDGNQYVQCCLIDIDECIELYGYLKTKKMIRGVPGILCWVKGNTSYIPDDIVNEGDPVKVTEFFKRCCNLLFLSNQ